MSRYGIMTEDENLEVFVGFDEGVGGFFLTIADCRTCSGEEGSYLFHNMDHHPGVGMTLEAVASTMNEFGITLPPDLEERLIEDARHGADVGVCAKVAASSNETRRSTGVPHQEGLCPRALRVLYWKSL